VNLRLVQQNQQLLASIYESARVGDWAALLARFDPGVVLHESTALPVGGTYRGIDAVGEVLGTLSMVLDGSSLEVEYVCADEHHAVASLRVRFADGRGETRLSEHITIRDGLAVEIRPFYWDTDAINAAIARANTNK
jgi:ketosteroid isomerase-like protein